DHLNDDSRMVRSESFLALGNEITLPLLQDRLARESVGELRKDLYSRLVAKYTSNPQARESLLKGAKDEKDPEVRRHLLNLLAKYFASDPKTWDLLRARKKDDSSESVRKEADALINIHEQSTG